MNKSTQVVLYGTINTSKLGIWKVQLSRKSVRNKRNDTQSISLL